MSIALNISNDISSNDYFKYNNKESQENQTSNSTDELSDAEKQLVKELATRDREVRTHEAAHQAVGGSTTGAATFTYQQGPDKKMYAIGGEVAITTPSASTPQETIKDAKKVAAAAMAAANPSAQDFAVAASAKVMEMKAKQQLAQEELGKITGQETYKDINSSKQESIPQESQIDLSA